MDLDTLGERFLELPEVDAVIVFGSLARGWGASAASDVDVLAICDRGGFNPAVADIAAKVSSEAEHDVSAVTTSWQGLRSRAERMPSFVAHLGQEGLLKAKTPTAAAELERVLASVDTSSPALREELQRISARIERLLDPERFQAAPVTTLGRIFSLARAIAILRLMLEDEQEWDWRVAFRRLAQLDPHLDGPLRQLQKTRPFYEALAGRIDLDCMDDSATEILYRQAAAALRALANLDSSVSA